MPDSAVEFCIGGRKAPWRFRAIGDGHWPARARSPGARAGEAAEGLERSSAALDSARPSPPLTERSASSGGASPAPLVGVSS